MSCQEYQSRFTEYLLGELESSEAVAIKVHLESGCKDCCQEFESVQEGVELMMESLRSVPLSDEEVAHHAAMAMKQNPPLQSGDTTYLENNRSIPSLVKHVMAYVAATAAGFLLVAVMNPAGLPEPIIDEPVANELFLGAKLPKESMNSISLVSLDSSSVATETTGFICLDFPGRQLHFFAIQLAPPPLGAQYALRVATDLSAQDFELTYGSNGVCKLAAPLPEIPIRQVELFIKQSSQSDSDAKPLLQFQRIGV